MADRRALGMLSGLSRGLAAGTQNLQNIMKASYEIKQNQELLNLKKKAIEADISTSAWEKDYKLKTYNLAEKELAIKEKTAEMAGEEHRAKLTNMQKVMDTIINQQRPAGGDNSGGGLDVGKDLGWSINTGTGAMTISKGKNESLTEQWRNDVKTARDSVANGEISADEATSILEDSYPDKASNIMEFRAMWSGLAPKGGKKKSQPNQQALIDKARQEGYTDEEVSAYLKGQ